MTKVTWYFDFISPFAYLQQEQFARFPDDIEIVCKPIVFGALLQHLGNRGPAEIDRKRLFIYRQAKWAADQQGLEFTMPPAHPFNPINCLRLAIAKNSDLGTIREIFRYIWRDGKDVMTEPGWAELCEKLNITDSLELVSQQHVKDQLRENTEEACERGLFGVPSLVVNDEIFWGQDMTGMFLDYIKDPDLFTKGEYAKMSDLPVGISRK